jgi:uncharacterized membrane protein YphA (DoxX/SURF4 family)
MMKMIGMLAFTVLLVTIGVGFLLFPREVQRIAARVQKLGPTPEYAKKIVNSPAYVWNVRFVAIVALAMAILMVIGIVKGN